MVFARRSIALALLLALAGALPALPGCAELGGGGNYTALPDLQPSGLKNLWQMQVGLGAGEKIAKAWRVGDSLYVTTNKARLVRIVATSGVKAWDVQIGVQTQEIFRPVDLGNGRILVLNQGKAFLLDKAAGVEMRSRSLSMIVTTDPVVHVASNTLCVGGLRYFYGMFLDQLGGQKWVTSSPSDLFVSTPAVVGDDVLLASRSGRLWRVNMPTGQWDWKDRKTNGAVVAGVSSDGGGMYVPALDSRVYAFGAQNGGELWEKLLEGTLERAAVPVRTQLLVPSTGKGLYSLSTETGDTQWVSPGATQIATVTGDHVWAEDDAGNLKSIGLESGDILSSIPVPAAQMVIYNSEDDLVFVANKAGVVGAFAPIR
jgi:outer membrane protein assembly factor BamB